MSYSIKPGDLQGLRIMVLGKLTAVSMTATAAFNVFKNGPNTCLLTHAAFTNFSAFPTGQILPTAFAFSWGLNSSTAPTDMRSAGAIGAGAAAPLVKTQDVSAQPSYIPPFMTFYFAVTTTTGGLGTMDVTFYGGILNK